jgi:hypothetical protein
MATRSYRNARTMQRATEDWVRTTVLREYSVSAPPPHPHGSTDQVVGLGLLIVKVSRSQSDTPHSVGLLWTRDQSDADTSLTDNTHKRQTSMPSEGFEPTIPASERPQTHALDRVAICICLVRSNYAAVTKKAASFRAVYRECVCPNWCDLETSKRGGLGPIWAVASQKKKREGQASNLITLLNLLS